jgi:ABC-type protease/lipase transport system fused ATPase/permease subunit
MVIVHRAAILSVYNKILFLKNGRAAFFGTRDEWVKAQQPQAQIDGDDANGRPALVKSN